MSEFRTSPEDRGRNQAISLIDGVQDKLQSKLIDRPFDYHEMNFNSLVMWVSGLLDNVQRSLTAPYPAAVTGGEEGGGDGD